MLRVESLGFLSCYFGFDPIYADISAVGPSDPTELVVYLDLAKERFIRERAEDFPIHQRLYINDGSFAVIKPDLQSVIVSGYYLDYLSHGTTFGLIPPLC